MEHKAEKRMKWSEKLTMAPRTEYLSLLAQGEPREGQKLQRKKGNRLAVTAPRKAHSKGKLRQ